MDEKTDGKFVGQAFTDDYLAHHGVLGMKWGVRNAETLRKYARSFGNRFKKDTEKKPGSGKDAVGGVIDKFGRNASKKVQGVGKKVSRKISESRRERRTEKSRAEKAGMTPKEYRKTAETNEELRRKALSSNNPKDVVSGLHTMTDQEVQDKLRRLVNEQKIKEISSEQAKTAKELVKETVKKAATDRILKPLVNDAADMAKDALKKRIFKEVAKTTGTSEDTVEKMAEAVEKTVKTELASTPAADVFAESKAKGFEYYSRYSGRYGSPATASPYAQSETNGVDYYRRTSDRYRAPEQAPTPYDTSDNLGSGHYDRNSGRYTSKKRWYNR